MSRICKSIEKARRLVVWGGLRGGRTGSECWGGVGWASGEDFGFIFRAVGSFWRIGLESSISGLHFEELPLTVEENGLERVSGGCGEASALQGSYCSRFPR